eukprot:TRINITY_DN4567_c0_g1_i1.p1 TRINITY_DN4567_c0_g1~~TRINITY_DN4567_c0_g1_i1.p1  ORF type:complete len:168 (+),score=28.68 TRINITY_DN4567_c0_g1_i1:44-547(+)
MGCCQSSHQVSNGEVSVRIRIISADPSASSIDKCKFGGMCGEDSTKQAGADNVIAMSKRQQQQTGVQDSFAHMVGPAQIETHRPRVLSVVDGVVLRQEAVKLLEVPKVQLQPQQSESRFRAAAGALGTVDSENQRLERHRALLDSHTQLLAAPRTTFAMLPSSKERR